MTATVEKRRGPQSGWESRAAMKANGLCGNSRRKSCLTQSLLRLYLMAAALSLATRAFARTDQEWFNAGVDYKVCPDWLLHFDQEIEFDNSKLVNEESYLLAGYEFCPYFMLAFGHRIVRERVDDKFHTEQRPTLELRLAAPEFWTLRLDFRSRFEYRDKRFVQPYMRYRERFRVRTSWSVTDFKISPYASEELFFSDKPGVSSSDVLDATRSQVGLSFHPVPSNDALVSDLYFMVLHSIGDGARDWSPLNIFGFEVAYAF